MFPSAKTQTHALSIVQHPAATETITHQIHTCLHTVCCYSPLTLDRNTGIRLYGALAKCYCVVQKETVCHLRSQYNGPVNAPLSPTRRHIAGDSPEASRCCVRKGT